ncbi:MAG: carboxypeptidase regulatory-like domain-containing protein, partial [Terracidiphilus sp.]
MSLLSLAFAVAMQTAAQTGAIHTGTLQGDVADPSGAVVPGAIVTLTGGSQVLTTQSGPAGNYVFRNLAPGLYTLTVAAPGFATLFIAEVAISDGRTKQLNLPLAIAIEKQQVTVESQNGSVGLAPDESSGATVIKGSALDALSDDPDELQSELEALAGPAAGPNGGQIYIDGFEGGQIPPKSSILEIRVNQNPFSAEFDRIGYGRIEIITKPGTQKLHGNISGYGNSSALNTSNPFISEQPGYYMYGVYGDSSGPFTKTSTWFFHADRFDRQNQTIVNALNPQNTAENLAEPFPTPSTYFSIGPRIDFDLGKNNMFTVREAFYRLTQSGSGVGALNLPEQASNGVTVFNELQIGDTTIVNAHFLNETHFVWDRTNNNQTPSSLAPTVTVQGAFTTGGSGAGTSRNHEDEFVLQNDSTATAGSHALRFGVRLRAYRDANSSTAGANGSYFFNSVASYLAGTPAQYSAAVIGNPVASAILFDGALFIQDDWRVSPDFELGLGLRLEGQNRIRDRADWAPRLSLAWSPGHRGTKPAKTVVRAGYGWFYDRFTVPGAFNGGSGTPYIIEAIHDNGVNQQSYVVSNPSFYDPNAPEPPSVLTGLSSTIPSYRTIDPHFHAALDMQGGVGIDRQLAKSIAANLTYLYTQGVHQYLTNNVTAPAFDPASYTITGPTPAVYNYQFQSGGIYKQQELIATLSARSRHFAVNGVYTLNHAASDTQGIGYYPSVPHDPSLDYGRAAFDIRHRFTLIDSYTGPHGIVVASLLAVQSGTPYNVTIGNDLTGNNQFNARPAYGVCGDADVISTQFGCLDTGPAGKGERIVPFDVGTSPANAVFHLRVSKVIGVGPRIEKAGAGQTF